MASDAMTVNEVLEGALVPFGVGTDGTLAKQMERMSQELSLLNTSLAGPVVQQATEGSKSEATRDSAVVPVLAGVAAGIGLTPFITGIASLFGGGGEKNELPPLVEFALPESARVNAGVSERVPGGPFLIDYAQSGMPRTRTTLPSQTNITVQVQAMDSRSFMDHSGDIARAVRQAMLESSVLNDVIREA
jgi:hypothetical protein